MSFLLYEEPKNELTIQLFKGVSLSGVRVSTSRVIKINGKEIRSAVLKWSGHTYTIADISIYVNGTLVKQRSLIPCWTDVEDLTVTHLIMLNDENEFTVICTGGVTFDLSLELIGEDLSFEVKPSEEGIPTELYIILGIIALGAIGYATGAFAKLFEILKRR